MSTTGAAVWIPAPLDWRIAANVTGGLYGVWLRDGEKVSWHFYYGPDGVRHVTGFTITKPAEH